MNGNGLFITFEGIDGTGKTTQAAMLADRLHADGYDSIKTREPGGTAGAEKIRELLINVAESKWSNEVEILLLTAARHEHVEKKIVPALESGKIVVCDRYVDSTRVYQGHSDSGMRDCIDALHERIIGKSPDLTFILDLPPRIALERIGKRGPADAYLDSYGDRIDSLRQGFLDLAREFPNRCIVVDASLPAKKIAELIRVEAMKRMQ
ncbi:MAG: dTMP kinase [Albidovulum sp.]|nr:dTMP kinase [Albidovulum sp.]